jgi:tetratricopeptide (TPR) repeat protein
VSHEAVELARRIRRPSTLAYALAGRGAAIIAPDTVDECFVIGTELCDLATEVGETEAVVDGHYHRLIAHLELGRLDEALLELEAMNQVAEALRQPAQLWQVSATRAMIALGVGAFEDARAFISQALAIGERAQGTMAIPAFRLQRFMLDDFEGTLKQSEDALADSVRQYPARPLLRCALAYLHARLGRRDEAQAIVDDLAVSDFAPLPFDFEWLYATSLLAEACVLVGDEASEGVLYKLLLPYSGLNVVDAPEGMRGPVARYLGILGRRTRSKNAERHFENAIEMNRTMGTRPWLAHAQEDYAEMLLIRAAPGDAERAEHHLDEALATYRELRMTGSLERARSLAGV